MSLADPTPDRTDADRAGPSPPQETVTPPEVGPVAAPPLAVTTAMEEDADPAALEPVAETLRSRLPPEMLAASRVPSVQSGSGP